MIFGVFHKRPEFVRNRFSYENAVLFTGYSRVSLLSWNQRINLVQDEITTELSGGIIESFMERGKHPKCAVDC